MPPPSLQGPIRCPAQPRCYCRDSGMVLTTRAASVAAGGAPKKVLVWFLCWSRRYGGTDELLTWRILASITWQSICIITS